MFLFDEIATFFNYRDLLEAYRSGGWASLMTPQGILKVAGPIIPIVLVVELMVIMLLKRLGRASYRVTAMTYVFNGILAKVIVIDVVALSIRHFNDHAVFRVGHSWYWFIYGYLVWEFSQFLFHYSSHKIRILWCMHSAHHAVEHMNLSVAYTSFFLQGAYAYAVRVSVCIFLGVGLPMLAIIMIIDGLWGGMAHISEEMLPDGAFGRLRHFILTPQHHRVHHARNPEYIDKNFCNLVNFWDHLFGTYQAPLAHVRPDFGVVRRIDASSFYSVYFGEFVFLWRDLRQFSGIRNKVLCLVMPPGWTPHGAAAIPASVRD